MIIKAPNSKITYTPNAAPRDLFWDLVAELYGGNFAIVETSKTQRVIGGAMQRKPLMGLQDIVARFEGDSSRFRPWTPTVAMLASKLGGPLPDSALISLYRDRHDWLDWHRDPETTVGPSADYTRVAIFSFGAQRPIEIKRIIGEPFVHWTPDDEIPAAPGSLTEFEGEAQRHFLHSIPSRSDARLSVSFTWRCRYDVEQACKSGEIPWALCQPGYAEGGLHAPYWVGPVERGVCLLARFAYSILLSPQLAPTSFKDAWTSIVYGWDEYDQAQVEGALSKRIEDKLNDRYDYGLAQKIRDALVRETLASIDEATPKAVLEALCGFKTDGLVTGRS